MEKPKFKLNDLVFYLGKGKIVQVGRVHSIESVITHESSTYKYQPNFYSKKLYKESRLFPNLTILLQDLADNIAEEFEEDEKIEIKIKSYIK